MDTDMLQIYRGADLLLAATRDAPATTEKDVMALLILLNEAILAKYTKRRMKVTLKAWVATLPEVACTLSTESPCFDASLLAVLPPALTGDMWPMVDELREALHHRIQQDSRVIPEELVYTITPCEEPTAVIDNVMKNARPTTAEGPTQVRTSSRKKTAPNRPDMEPHSVMAPGKGTRFICMYCQERKDSPLDGPDFPNKKTLCEHMKNCHAEGADPNQTLKCPACQHVFQSNVATFAVLVSRLMKHAELTHSIISVRQDGRRKIKNEKVKADSSRVALECIMCKEAQAEDTQSSTASTWQFESHVDLKKHITQTHMEKHRNIYTLHCPYCDKKSSTNKGAGKGNVDEIMKHIMEKHRVQFCKMEFEPQTATMNPSGEVTNQLAILSEVAAHEMSIIAQTEADAKVDRNKNFSSASNEEAISSQECNPVEVIIAENNTSEGNDPSISSQDGILEHVVPPQSEATLHNTENVRAGDGATVAYTVRTSDITEDVVVKYGEADVNTSVSIPPSMAGLTGGKVIVKTEGSAPVYLELVNETAVIQNGDRNAGGEHPPISGDTDKITVGNEEIIDSEEDAADITDENSDLDFNTDDDYEYGSNKANKKQGTKRKRKSSPKAKVIVKKEKKDGNNVIYCVLCTDPKSIKEKTVGPGNLMFKNMGDLRNHIRDEHIQGEGIDQYLICPLCHMERHTIYEHTRSMVNAFLNHVYRSHGVCYSSQLKQHQNTNDYDDEDDMHFPDNSMKWFCLQLNPPCAAFRNRMQLVAHVIEHHLEKDHDKAQHQLSCTQCQWESRGQDNSGRGQIYISNKYVDHCIISHAMLAKQKTVGESVVGRSDGSGALVIVQPSFMGSDIMSTNNEADKNNGVANVIMTPQSKTKLGIPESGDGKGKAKGMPKYLDYVDLSLGSGPYRCFLCIQPSITSPTFMKRAEMIDHFFENHITQAENSALLLKCPDCPKQCSRLPSDRFMMKSAWGLIDFLLSHMVKKHGFPVPQHCTIYTCKICGLETILSEWVMTYHMRRTHGLALDKEGVQLTVSKETDDLKPIPKTTSKHEAIAEAIARGGSYDASAALTTLQCSKCHMTFTSRHALYMHVRFTHHKLKNILCCMCGKDFYQDYELVAHAWSIHKVNLGKQDLVECEICGEQMVKKLLHNHRKKHNTEVFTCDKCGKVMKHNANFASHMRKHEAMSEGLQCSLCGFMCASKKTLVNHLSRVHHIERHQCPLCKHVAQSQEGMQNHLNKVHSDGTTVNYCVICKKQFCNKGSFENHMFVSHKLNIAHRPVLTCSVCSMQTLGAALMRKHMANHLPVTGDFQCDVCDKPFKNARQKREHEKRTHGDKNRQCPHCTYTSTTESHFARHIYRHHSELQTVHVCTQCSYMTLHRDRYHNHLRKTHGVGKLEEEATLAELSKMAKTDPSNVGRAVPEEPPPVTGMKQVDASVEVADTSLGSLPASTIEMLAQAVEEAQVNAELQTPVVSTYTPVIAELRTPVVSTYQELEVVQADHVLPNSSAQSTYSVVELAGLSPYKTPQVEVIETQLLMNPQSAHTELQTSNILKSTQAAGVSTVIQNTSQPIVYTSATFLPQYNMPLGVQSQIVSSEQSGHSTLSTPTHFIVDPITQNIRQSGPFRSVEGSTALQPPPLLTPTSSYTTPVTSAAIHQQSLLPSVTKFYPGSQRSGGTIPSIERILLRSSSEPAQSNSYSSNTVQFSRQQSAVTPSQLLGASSGGTLLTPQNISQKADTSCSYTVISQSSILNPKVSVLPAQPSHVVSQNLSGYSGSTSQPRSYASPSLANFTGTAQPVSQVPDVPLLASQYEARLMAAISQLTAAEQAAGNLSQLSSSGSTLHSTTTTTAQSAILTTLQAQSSQEHGTELILHTSDDQHGLSAVSTPLQYSLTPIQTQGQTQNEAQAIARASIVKQAEGTQEFPVIESGDGTVTIVQDIEYSQPDGSVSELYLPTTQ